MVKIVVMLFAILVLMDSVAISALRRFLKDFLIGERNRKNAQKIYLEQSLKDRFFLGFIKSYLKEYIVAFKVYHWIYLIDLWSLIPQYALLLAVYIPNVEECSRVPLYVMIGIKALLNLFVRVQVDSLMRSKYRKGK